MHMAKHHHFPQSNGSGCTLVGGDLYVRGTIKNPFDRTILAKLGEDRLADDCNGGSPGDCIMFLGALLSIHFNIRC